MPLSKALTFQTLMKEIFTKSCLGFMYKLEKKITILGVLRSFFLPFFSKFPREWKYNTSKLKEISATSPMCGFQNLK